MLTEPRDGLRNALFETDVRFPSRRAEPRDVQQLLWRPVRLRGVPFTLTLIANDAGHHFCQFPDRHVTAGTNIDLTGAVVVFEKRG